ncbi:MAG: DUF2958 domain-containing protein [Flavobacteriaceae bacterium]|nr:MAG: DUF2958 domain-containing protein [Flavobacteriaceae bacterium]
MKLITEELKKRFTEIGDQSEDKNPIIVTKFFDPCGSATWYATEYNSETNTCFGYVSGLVPDMPICDEWGAFSIDELESAQRQFPKIIFGNQEYIPEVRYGIERDIHFKETRFNQLIEKQHLIKSEKNTSNKLKERLDSLEVDSQDVSKDHGFEIEF